MTPAAAPAAVQAPLWQRSLRGLTSFAVWSTAMYTLVYAQAVKGLYGTPILLFNAAAAALVYCLCVIYIERREPLEFSLRGAGVEFAAGFGIGLGIFAITIGVFALAGWYHVRSFNPAFNVLSAGFVFCLTTAVFEEIFARGYVCRFVQSSLGTYAAIAVSSAIFGFMHLTNPSATPWSCAAIAVEAGVLLASVYVLTGRLWIAIGLHLSWNFAEGTLFGTPVSGIAFPSITQATLLGPQRWTGGAFGPEASLVTVIVSAAVSIAAIATVVRDGKLLPPLWVRRAASQSQRAA